MDQLNGTYLPFFQWNYEVEEAVSDLTDYQYQMLLDGLEYAKGRLVTEEGVHRLRVRAEDAAGNQVKKVIRFEIRPGKSIVQKIWKPVEDLFQDMEKKLKIKWINGYGQKFFGAAGILILLWYGWRMKRTGKRRK